jgi:geranylgeranyl reductase family protein
MIGTEDIVIIGGGPAGSYCALELAKRGIYATIFDHSHPREKACGGGISSLTLEKFPFLEQFRSYGGSPKNLKMISCTSSQTIIEQQSGFNISRQFLDQQILKIAIKNGAKLVDEKLVSIERKQNFWRIKFSEQTIISKILVGADGVNSIIRKKMIAPISSKNLAVTYGYLVTGTEYEPTTIKFIAEIPGYIWIFPRGNHSCIGIGSELRYGEKLKKILDNFISYYCSEIKILSKFAALLPSASESKFFTLPCCGDNWLLVGDAAGHVDPVTGGGILYALWSGKLAAEVIANGDLDLYDELWRKQYGNYFMERCKVKKAFYDPLEIEVSFAMHAIQSKFEYFA